MGKGYPIGATGLVGALLGVMFGTLERANSILNAGKDAAYLDQLIRRVYSI